MRLALVGAVVDVAEDAEAELGIFVQYLARRHVVAEIRGDEFVILQYIADQRAYLLAPFDTRVLLENAVTLRRELFEAVSHFIFSCIVHNANDGDSCRPGSTQTARQARQQITNSDLHASRKRQ